MTKIAVSVKRDHIEALAATKRPIVSLAELIWNGLDADADKVSIRFDENALDGLERIRVADNGSGIAFAEAQLLFGSLGGSWKSQKGRTAKGRSLHGKSGKGRFRAFALGNLVEWNPDWAILKHDDAVLYLVRETKGTRNFEKLRTSEAEKVRCGRKHFDALGVNFDVVTSVTELD